MNYLFKDEKYQLPEEKEEEVVKPIKEAKKFNNFLIANAFGSKDKLNLWIYFRQALQRGASMEELNGILFWKVKDMILKKDFRKFKESELVQTAAKLSYLIPEARKSSFDPEYVFEQFLLEVF